MRLSVIICTYNRADFLKRALESIAAQTINKDKFELLIINNNSTDNTENIVKDFIENNPEINTRYFVEKNTGLSYARNRGIKESGGDILIFLDDDAIASKNYLSEVMYFFETTSSAAAMGGKVVPVYEGDKPSWMSKFIELLVSKLDLGDKNKIFKGGKYPIGANMAIRKDVIDKVGMFDVNLGRKGSQLLGGEEKDIFDRIKKIGDIWYNAKAWVFHYIPKSRTNEKFIKKLAESIGHSEKLRTLPKGNIVFLRALLKEFFLKWPATIILLFYYFFTLRFSKGIMLVRFRFWVTKGLLG